MQIETGKYLIQAFREGGNGLLEERPIELSWTQEDRELMQGACDMHVHLAPCLFHRLSTEEQFVRSAISAGYSAAISKCHHGPNAERLASVNQPGSGFTLFGGIVLNHFVGGLNPYAVEASIRAGGKCVWMPTMHAQNHVDTFGEAAYARLTYRGGKLIDKYQSARGPISALDEKGRIKPELQDIIELIAAGNNILATGHFGVKEIVPLIKAARQAGVKKIVVTHAEMEVSNLSVAQQVDLAEMGAYIEHVILPCLPIYARLDPAVFLKSIEAVGAEHTVLSTDLGQLYNPHPAEGMRQFARTLIYKGLDRARLDTILKRNPCDLLDVEINTGK